MGACSKIFMPHMARAGTVRCVSPFPCLKRFLKKFIVGLHALRKGV